MVRRQQAADRAIRPKLRSPGHPKFQRHVEVAFWAQTAKGMLPEEASAVAGVASAVGARWFRNAGGMAPFDISTQPSGRYLCFSEREEIAVLRAQGKGVREIARTVGFLATDTTAYLTGSIVDAFGGVLPELLPRSGSAQPISTS